jgi:hypothetical protein
MLVGERNEPVERALGQPSVGVQDQRVTAGGDRQARVPAGPEPAVLALEEPHLGKELADDVDRPVGGAVVDDDRLHTAHALQA